MHRETIVWSERAPMAPPPKRTGSLRWTSGVIALSAGLIALAVGLAAWQTEAATLLG